MERFSRRTHVGKNRYEKEAYKNFLSKHFYLDKTQEDPQNFSKSDSSTFEEEDLKPYPKPRKKSRKLKIRDFIHNNWTVTIVGGLIVVFIPAAIAMKVDQSVQKEKILQIEERLDKSDEEMGGIKESFYFLREELKALGIGFTKDIEYLKKQPK